MCSFQTYRWYIKQNVILSPVEKVLEMMRRKPRDLVLYLYCNLGTTFLFVTNSSWLCGAVLALLLNCWALEFLNSYLNRQQVQWLFATLCTTNNVAHIRTVLCCERIYFGRLGNLESIGCVPSWRARRRKGFERANCKVVYSNFG